MASAELVLNPNELVVDEGLGYPRAYAKLCRDGSFSPFNNGPPSAFVPYALQPQQDSRAREFDDELFPILDPDAEPATKTKLFVGLLWKQLDHLGNAGFDPAIFRVDLYGNVLYYHADSASPLAWDVDHWFPCSRGGLSVPSNLRILQWQVCKRKHNKLEFLIPWWDLQLGISVNQFLSIFASSNSDFRHRGLSFLFLEAEDEDLIASETADSHRFPQHFITSQKKIGLAPAAIVSVRRDRPEASILKSLDHNKLTRGNSPMIVRKSRTPVFKENAVRGIVSNPNQAIIIARDSFAQREEAMKKQQEIQKLDEEMSELKLKNEEDKMSIQELELKLMKSRRRAEKHRRLAEAQASYRNMLEKMVRDAMHQSVVYKEQVRLNQAATNALTARLETQKAICDDSEKELFKRCKQRDDIEQRARPYMDQARKRTRMCVDEETLSEANADNKIVLSLPSTEPEDTTRSARKDSLLERRAADSIVSSIEDVKSNKSTINPLYDELCNKALLSYAQKKARASSVRKQLKVFLEEEQRASREGLTDKVKQEEQMISPSEYNPECKDQDLLSQIGRGKIATFEEEEVKEDDESRWHKGRGNVERWLQMLLENSQGENAVKEQQQQQQQANYALIRTVNYEGRKEEEEEEVLQVGSGVQNKKSDETKRVTMKMKNRASFEWRGGSSEKRVKEKGLIRSESARSFRFPSSPSIILGMRKGVDCMRKKSIVMSDEDKEDGQRQTKAKVSVNSSVKSIKNAVKI